MKYLLLLLFAALLTVNAELTPDQAAAVRKRIGSTTAPELPAVVARLVKDASPANRSDVAKLAAQIVKTQRPAALKLVLEAIPAANRPTITPGNENGNRPEIPPGMVKYASP
jgi:hypothetical protein